jgi:hypothetical protein
MVRNVLGAVLAAIGAAAAVYSPFRAWYDHRHGTDVRVQDLFGGITTHKASLMLSILLPMIVAAVIAVGGVLLRLRPLVALAGVVVLGFTILWMVQQGRYLGELTVAGNGSGLGEGVGEALGGGVLLLAAALVMSGRPPAAAGERDDAGTGRDRLPARAADADGLPSAPPVSAGSGAGGKSGGSSTSDLTAELKAMGIDLDDPGSAAKGSGGSS